MSVTSFCCSCGATWPIGQSACLDTQPTVQLQAGARFSREIDRAVETSSSSDRQKKSFEDNHFAPRNCTANYDAFYVDPYDWNYGYCLPRNDSGRFMWTLLKSLFPRLIRDWPFLRFFSFLFMEFQIKEKKGKEIPEEKAKKV